MEIIFPVSSEANDEGLEEPLLTPKGIEGFVLFLEARYPGLYILVTMI